MHAHPRDHDAQDGSTEPLHHLLRLVIRLIRYTLSTVALTMRALLMIRNTMDARRGLRVDRALGQRVRILGRF